LRTLNSYLFYYLRRLYFGASPPYYNTNHRFLWSLFICYRRLYFGTQSYFSSSVSWCYRRLSFGTKSYSSSSLFPFKPLVRSAKRSALFRNWGLNPRSFGTETYQNLPNRSWRIRRCSVCRFDDAEMHSLPTRFILCRPASFFADRGGNAARHQPSEDGIHLR
jgi:hypothetical protein